MVIKTHRLILRPWCTDDAQSLYKYASDPDIGIPAGWPPHTSVQNSREIIKNILSAENTFAVCTMDNIAIGSVGLKTGDATDMTDKPDECELGYWIGKEYWGKGYIPEAAAAVIDYAFEKLSMNAIWCGYYDGNEKSKRVQEKLGFVYNHTADDVEVSLLNEVRTGHSSLLTKEQWLKNR